MEALYFWGPLQDSKRFAKEKKHQTQAKLCLRCFLGRCFAIHFSTVKTIQSLIKLYSLWSSGCRISSCLAGAWRTPRPIDAAHNPNLSTRNLLGLSNRNIENLFLGLRNLEKIKTKPYKGLYRRSKKQKITRKKQNHVTNSSIYKINKKTQNQALEGSLTAFSAGRPSWLQPGPKLSPPSAVLVWGMAPTKGFDS